MNHQTTKTTTPHHQGSLLSYTVGFILSLVLTIIPFFAVMEGLIAGPSAILLLTGCALAQLLVQLFLFLHLGGKGQRWNLMVFLFMLLVVIILVVGTLWIMNNLHYNMVPTEQIDQYMSEQSQKGF